MQVKGDDVACQNAIKVVEMGYVAFAVDLYGDAAVATDLDGMLAHAMPLVENRNLLLQRMQAGLKALTDQSPVDTEINLVPKVGIEPTRCCHHRILNPARLPVPPLRHHPRQCI